MDSLHSILAKLQYIARLREIEGGKLNPMYNSVDTGLFANIWRYFHHDECNRAINYKYVKTVLEESFQAVELYNMKRDQFISENIKYLDACKLLIQAIKECLCGVSQMKLNYERERADAMFLAEVTSYVKISEKRLEAWMETLGLDEATDTQQQSDL